MIDTIYGLCKGDENDEAMILSQSYECLEDAIQRARECNEYNLNLGRISLKGVCEFWEQRTGNDLSELLTAGLVDKNVAEIAEAAKEKYGHKLSPQEAIDTVIQDCYESGFLPCGWYGVFQMTFYRNEEE